VYKLILEVLVGLMLELKKTRENVECRSSWKRVNCGNKIESYH